MLFSNKGPSIGRILAPCCFAFCLSAAQEAQPIRSWTSPSEALKAEAISSSAESPRTIFLFEPSKPEVRQQLCTFSRDASVVFSPDEKWIALNDHYGSDRAKIRLFKRVAGLKYAELKVDPANAAWALLHRRHRVPYPKDLDHYYAHVSEWSADSMAVLVSLSGHTDANLAVGGWLCVFDLRTGKASLDLGRMNRGTVVFLRSSR
jgi:hypothetical protein